LKNDVNVPSKSKKQKNFKNNKFFVGILKVNGENSRIWIHQSEAWIRGSGYKPKCHTALDSICTVVFLILAVQFVSTLLDLCERMVGEDVGEVARVVAHSTVCVATEGLF
jgi:hypothetical protein